jgi:non-heme chloroperoxidase
MTTTSIPLQLREVSLVAEAAGSPEAPPVVLLHGGGQTRHAWHWAVTELAQEGFYALAYDMRGHGDSTWAPDGDYSLDRLGDDIAGIVDALPRPAALVGASIGGASALLAVAERDIDVTALVLVDVATRFLPSGADQINGFMTAHPDGFASLEEASAVISAYRPGRPPPSDLSGLRKNLRLGSDGRWRWHWDPQFMFGEHKPSASQHTDRLDRAVVRLGERGVPILLVRGARSELVAPEAVDYFMTLAPHTRHVDVAEAGHMVAGDRNDKFSDAVITFLKEAVPGDRRSRRTAQ